jgi:photosystem II stability/assembly factor-like uncharacterized protein
MRKRLAVPSVFIALWISCAKKVQTVVPQAPQPATATRKWTEVAVPFKPTNISALDGTFWLCGPDEMIASSSDGGTTWKLRHQNRGGKTLLNVSFINERVGHAGGEGGLLLSTTDGGKTWKAHSADDDVQEFSFANDDNGIAVIGGDRDTVMDGAVKLTHDGGEHWEEIAALNSEQLRPFTHVLAVAALDSSHELMIRRQPTIEDAFVITQDAGRSWKVVHMRNDATNRELATRVFVRDGQYWAFGMELVNRQQGGGYGVPLTMHSKDGETWAHGVNGGLHEFGGCNPQGCYMWDGTVETLYGEREKYWALPQDGSLSKQWAIAGGHACTISATIKCGPAVVTDAPQPRPPRPRPAPDIAAKAAVPTWKVAVPDGCDRCDLNTIPWESQQKLFLWTVANFTVHPDGSVADLSLDPPLHEPLDGVVQQVAKWRFQPPHDGIAVQRSVRIVVQCSPEFSGCRLLPTVAGQ